VVVEVTVLNGVIQTEVLEVVVVEVYTNPQVLERHVKGTEQGVCHQAGVVHTLVLEEVVQEAQTVKLMEAQVFQTQLQEQQLITLEVVEAAQWLTQLLVTVLVVLVGEVLVDMVQELIQV
jgi:hypothetical protein